MSWMINKQVKYAGKKNSDKHYKRWRKRRTCSQSGKSKCNCNESYLFLSMNDKYSCKDTEANTYQKKYRWTIRLKYSQASSSFFTQTNTGDRLPWQVREGLSEPVMKEVEVIRGLSASVRECRSPWWSVLVYARACVSQWWPVFACRAYGSHWWCDSP